MRFSEDCHTTKLSIAGRTAKGCSGGFGAAITATLSAGLQMSVDDEKSTNVPSHCVLEVVAVVHFTFIL